MGMMYAAAPRLIIWLGPPHDESDKAIEELRNL